METNFNAFDISNYLKAINLLYRGGNDIQLKKKANKFLIDFEKQHSSWDNAIAILKMEGLEEEAIYLATNILKKKLKFDFINFYENVNVCTNLANFLIEIIHKFKSQKFYILMNICRCFAILAMFSHKVIPNMLNLISSELGKGDDIENSICLLLIFSYFAEISQDMDIIIDENYRKSFIIILLDYSDSIIFFINRTINEINLVNNSKEENIVNTRNHRVDNKAIIECLTNWFNLGLPINVLSKLEIDYNSIIEFIFNIDNNNLPEYSECICLLLGIAMANKELGILGSQILKRIISFKERVFTAISMDDEEEIKFFIDIYEDLCSNNLETIYVENRVDLIQIMVELSKKVPPNRINSITDFWQRFLYFLKDYNIQTNEILNKYGGLINDTILGLIKLLKFPNDIFIGLNQNKKKDYKKDDSYVNTKEYRDNLKYFLQDFSNIFSFDYFYLNLLLPQIKTIVASLETSPHDMYLWCCLEALLYCFSCVAKTINASQDLSFLDNLCELIFRIPAELIQIKRTATDIFDEISKLFCLKPDLLIKVITYVLEGLENPLTISNIYNINHIFTSIEYCSASLKHLFSDNAKHLFKNRSELINLYYTKFKERLVDNEYYKEILEGLMEVLCYGNDIIEIKQSIDGLLLPWKEKLKTFYQIQKEFSTKEIEDFKQVIIVIKILVRSIHSSLSSLYMKEVMTNNFNDLWPFIKFFMEKFFNNEDLIEEICQLMKHLIRGMGENFKSFLESYLEIVINGYRIIPISSYLYSFEILATVFMRDITTRNIFKTTLDILINQTLTYLPNIDEFENHPELSEDFFGLLERIIRINPFLIYESSLFENLVVISINCIGINHIDTAKNNLCFLDRVINIQKLTNNKEIYSSEIQTNIIKIKAIISKLGGVLSNKIIDYIMSVPPEIIFENLKEFIKNFMVNFPEETFIWFEAALKVVPTDCLTNNEKESFTQQIKSFNEINMDKMLFKFQMRCLRKIQRV